ncbi:hypothetical protein SAM23877_3874 [Streptomyces ambofaciens ATCC 23877]|uniref:Uncharacterized protein n=2 Tax=Streptomyces ambofaciens TaxID=1889 RepID=A0A0K2AV73_STRA7|nr:hypothetical protein [Streptomyces ambofaciens]AKZ56919.1 hypothetical protein SAM23877_3874 [Streptomyces ambofaciens ATCC 23877]ANB07478.1 hypothetical protein SAM40697_3520 [Streptomyces ambofaciens]
MAEGDGVATHGIRVRLDGTASESDIDALHKWLEREKPLADLARTDQLRIDERIRIDEAGAPMGTGMDIVVAVLGGAAGAIFQSVVDQVRRSVEAWRANRREVENGEPPEASVEPVRPDGR